MKTSWLKKIFHPVSTFIFLQILFVSFTAMWVIWEVFSNDQMADIAEKLGQKSILNDTGIIVLICGSVLLAFIFIGIILLFVHGIKQAQLNLRQKYFLSSVTHELRSPLTSIQLAVETLSRNNLNEENKERLFTVISSESTRLLRFVDQLLISAKLDKGIIEFETKGSTNIGAVYNQVLAHLRIIYGDRALKIHYNDQGQSIQIPAFALQLILTNLFENAIKYSPTDSPIHFFVSKSEKGTEFKVVDLGFGFEKNEKRKLFKMFARGDISRKKAVSGSGLGLFIVKTLVKVMHGKVWIESAGRDKGSTVFLFFPNKA